MSYKEKRTIVSIVTGILVLASYGIYVMRKFQSGMAASENVKFWASTMLVFIGIGIAAAIAIQILFHILLSVTMTVQKSGQNGKHDCKKIEETIEAEMVEDEMDKLIALKSMKFGFIIAGMGFIVALVSAVLGYSPAVMLNIMFVSFSTGSLFEGFTQLYYYRKGINHG